MGEKEKKYMNLCEEEGQLTYITENTEHIDSVVLGMLKCNRISGLLNVQIRQKNEEMTFIYNTADMITVEEYLAEEKWLLSTVEVLEQLTEIILRLSEYMIEEEYLIFESSHIYIDRNGDLRCVCVPELSEDVTSFKTFALLLIEQIKVNRYAEIEPKNRLKKCLVGDSFSIELFAKDLISVRLELRKVDAKQARAQENGNVVLGHRDRLVSEEDQKNEEMKTCNVNGEESEPGENHSTAPVVVLRRNKNSDNEGFLNVQSTKTTVEETMQGLQSQDIGDPMEKLSIKTDEINVVLSRNCRIAESKKPDIRDVWNKPNQGIGLVRKKTNETFWLHKESGYVGRGKSGVDIVIPDNYLISKKHVKLFRRGDQYFLQDQNSTNRTFLNGKLMQYGEEYEVKNGDIVRLANEIFTLKINESDPSNRTT